MTGKSVKGSAKKSRDSLRFFQFEGDVETLIFDASSTYIMIKSKNLQALRDSTTLDLAFYEIGNAIVQEEKMGIISENMSGVISQVVQSLHEIMNVVPFQKLKAGKVLQEAKRSGLTFYDASVLDPGKGEYRGFGNRRQPARESLSKVRNKDFLSSRL